MALAPPLTIWTVTDGRAGIENQALGLAEAIQRLVPAHITSKRLRFRPLFGRWPNVLRVWPGVMLTADSDRLDPPYPDLVIANGRASLPFSSRMKRWSDGRTFVVQLQDPRSDLKPFDLVIPPLHDSVSGPNVFPILGSPNRITAGRLNQEAEPFRALLTDLPRPHVTVLIGGRSSVYDLNAEVAIRLADQIAQAVEASGGSLLLTYSRRTPGAARAALTSRLEGVPGLIWDGEGPNPYFAFLETADHILVTADSVNMAAEAAATGKPVQILQLDGGGGKFDAFHAGLECRGAARHFSGWLESWSYAPLNETERAAKEVLSRMSDRH